jgi:hypothetical protein
LESGNFSDLQDKKKNVKYETPDNENTSGIDCYNPDWRFIAGSPPGTGFGKSRF